MEKLCSSLGLTWHEPFPYAIAPCTKYIEYAAKEYLLDGGTSNKSVVEQTLEVMSRMGLDPKSEFAICDDGKTLALWLNHVYDRYTKYRKDYAIAGETLTYAQFKNCLLYTSDASADPRRVDPGGHRVTKNNQVHHSTPPSDE